MSIKGRDNNTLLFVVPNYVVVVFPVFASQAFKQQKKALEEQIGEKEAAAK